MKIVSLLDNISGAKGITAEHGLSLYIQTRKHKVLFDTGASGKFLKNAKALGVDLSAVDVAVISHGHFDHGGGLKTFLSVNDKAKIYIQKTAFEKYYTKFLFLKINVGLDKSLPLSRFTLVDGDFVIDDELSLVCAKGNTLISPANASLLDKDFLPDKFTHEQNLLIKENSSVLVTGCSHRGIINALNAVGSVDACIGGFHTYNPALRKYVSDDYLNALGEALKAYDCKFYTCHCTGKKACEKLNEFVPVKYLKAGESIDLGGV